MGWTSLMRLVIGTCAAWLLAALSAPAQALLVTIAATGAHAIQTGEPDPLVRLLVWDADRAIDSSG
jgi:hypothetical protein